MVKKTPFPTWARSEAGWLDRRWAAPAALAAPALILLLWWGIGVLAARATAPPRWVIPTAGMYAGSCAAAADLDVFDTRPAQPGASVTISAEQARRRADRLILNAGARGVAVFGGGPSLITAVFPDGQERAAWFRVLVLDTGPDGTLGAASVAYIDASTGEPLLLLTGVQIGDPVMTCGLETAAMEAMVRRTLPAVLLALYAVLVGGIWLVRQARRREASDAASMQAANPEHKPLSWPDPDDAWNTPPEQ